LRDFFKNIKPYRRPETCPEPEILLNAPIFSEGEKLKRSLIDVSKAYQFVQDY